MRVRELFPNVNSWVGVRGWVREECAGTRGAVKGGEPALKAQARCAWARAPAGVYQPVLGGRLRGEARAWGGRVRESARAPS